VFYIFYETVVKAQAHHKNGLREANKGMSFHIFDQWKIYKPANHSWGSLQIDQWWSFSISGKFTNQLITAEGKNEKVGAIHVFST